jgi:NDP-mannose synthase
MNGDVLTTLDYEELYEAHLNADNALTLACQQRVVAVDYGVLRVKGNGSTATAPIVDYEEKPEIHYTVSMGVYVISPRALRHIPSEGALDIPDLVLRLIDAGERVGSYRYDGLWLDIGRRDDYERALNEYGPSHQGPLVNGSELGAVASSAPVATQP